MKYETILFDLDGTLTDPGDGITNSVAYALLKFGIDVTERKSLNRFIGPPLIDSFSEFYGFSIDDARLAVKYYREYFTAHGMFENIVYPLVPEMLEALKKAGKRLIVATSKPEPFSEEILKHFGLYGFFEKVAGSTLDETRTEKADVISYALDCCGIKPDRRAVMVGDRKHDVLGAKKNGLSCIGVLFGYGSREELTDAGACFLAEDVLSLQKELSV